MPRPTGEDHHNWKGGKTITEHGYVLLRVGTDHHLADVRGYAYEHRVVAEQKLGRRLCPSEIVHHINEDRADNRPGNLRVCENIAAHLARHRGRQDLRLPDEPNPIIECGCGCGERFRKYDESGRPRQYLPDHNDHPAPTQDAVLAAFSDRPLSRSEICDVTDIKPRCVSTALQKLKAKGFVSQVHYRLWKITAKEKEVLT